jgi:hypothetical protein
VKKITIYGLFLLALATSCRKEKTNWDSDWVVPVVNDTLSFKNLVNDSTLAVDALGFYELDLTRTIIDFGIDKFIQIPDTTIIQDFNVPTALTVSPGFSIVNQIEEHTLDVDGIQLKKIRVSEGSIKLKVFNPIETIAFFTVQLPGVSKNGVPFVQNYQAPGGTVASPGITTAVLDLSGYDIDLTGTDGSAYNILQSKLQVTSDPNGPSVSINAQDVFKVQAEFKDVKIDYARGYFGNLSISDTTDYLLEPLANLTAGTIDLPWSDIQIEVINGLKVGAKATIALVKNTNYTGNTVSLSAPQIGTPVFLDPATGSWSSLVNSTEILAFDHINSNVEQYLENLGKKHTLGYKIELNPWGNVSGGWNEIFPNSRLKVRIKAQMPLAVGADGLTLRDTFDFHVAQNQKTTHIESGELVLNAVNAIPLSADAVLFLMDDAGNIIHTVTGTSPVLSAKSGTVDPSDNLQKMSSEVSFVLTSAMILDLDLIKKIAVQVKLDTPNPQTGLNEMMNIPAGAFMSVKLKARFKLRAAV